jgi:hypothetical protein
MRRRVALCSWVVGGWLVATSAFGQAAPAKPATAPAAGAPAAAAPATATPAPAAPQTTATGAAPAVPTGTTTSADGSTSVTATQTQAAGGIMDAGTYAVRLVDLEQRINELKEQVFRSKARLALLAETILQGVVGGSQNLVVLENGMTNTFELVGASFALDGAPIFFRADESGEFGKLNEIDIYNGAIVPGEHTLTVSLELRGRGYGVFSYLQGYHFTLTSSHSFTAPEGRAIRVRVVSYEQGGPMTPINERPNVRFEEAETESFVPQSEAQAQEGAKSVAPGAGAQGSATTTGTGVNISAGAQGGK